MHLGARRTIILIKLRTAPRPGRTGLSWPLLLKHGHAEAREGVLKKLAYERTTELVLGSATECPKVTYQNYRKTVELCTRLPDFNYLGPVGISCTAKFFPTGLWKF